MKAKNILKAIFDRVGTTKRSLAEKAGVSDVVVGKAFRAEGIGLSVAARYLKLMGYDLYAVPDTLHIDMLSDEAIKVEPNESEDSI